MFTADVLLPEPHVRSAPVACGLDHDVARELRTPTADPDPVVAPSPGRLGRLRHAIEAGRAICYLDHMVGELIDAIPPSKPWQRQLLVQLATAQREIQVLRMTIALNRNAQEILAAGLLVHATLANAHTAAIKGRAPLLMKGEMRFAHEVSKRIKSALEVICDVPESRQDRQ